MTNTREFMKSEAVRLREEERLSYAEIHARLGVAKSTLSGWLKGHPLSRGELRKKMSAKTQPAPKKVRGPESLLHQMVSAKTLSPHDKAKVAEAAVLLRLVLHGLTTFGSIFDGDKADWLVETPKGRLCRLQVKWATTYGAHGLPRVSLCCSSGHRGDKRRYQRAEFDVIVGYDLFTDTCYVWTWDEVEQLATSVSVCDGAAERWDKILGM